MKKRFTLDYFLYVAAKSITLFVRIIPLRLSIFAARSLGAVAFYCLVRKRATAYKNVKTAFASFSHQRIQQIVKRTFMNSAQHCIEIAHLPWIDQRYIDTCIEIENVDAVRSVLNSKKGAIFLGLHEGSWEVTCAVLARVLKQYNYTVLARPQKNIPLLNELLEEYRRKNYCGVMRIKDSLRPPIEHLKKGYALGVVADHGAQGGIFVDFFGKPALTPTGGVKLALKLDTHIIIGYTIRKGGAAHTITLTPYRVVRTGDVEKDVKTNLENLNRVFEKHIRQSPEEYLWFFKRWKYSPRRDILIVSDGKAGHLKQSLAVADCVRRLPFEVKESIVEVTFRSRLARGIFEACGLFLGRRCHNGMRCILRSAITPDQMTKLFSGSYDLIISCGSSIAMVNTLLALEHKAKSVVIMKPGIVSMKQFDLVIVPEHDYTTKYKNVVVTKGALSRSVNYDDHSVQDVVRRYHLESASLAHPVIGFVVGGDNKHLSLELDSIKSVVGALKQVVERSGATIVATTSRRTPTAIEQFLKQELEGYAACKMLVIANDDNPKGSIDALFHSSDMLVISGDSISMISEALGYGKYVFVFPLTRKKPQVISKHERFIQRLENEGYLNIIGDVPLDDSLMDTWQKKPAIQTVPDSSRIIEALKTIV